MTVDRTISLNAVKEMIKGLPDWSITNYHRDKGLLNSPNFQSIYVCNRLLDNQIVFDETTF